MYINKTWLAIFLGTTGLIFLVILPGYFRLFLALLNTQIFSACNPSLITWNKKSVLLKTNFVVSRDPRHTKNARCSPARTSQFNLLIKFQCWQCESLTSSLVLGFQFKGQFNSNFSIFSCGPSILVGVMR